MVPVNHLNDTPSFCHASGQQEQPDTLTVFIAEGLA